MDAQMKQEDITQNYPIWDLEVTNGIVPILTDDKEDIQTALLASFIEKGTIPQLPEHGVAWTDFLTGQITFGELDVLIRDSISKAGKDLYRPEYQIENDRLTLLITKEIQ